MLIGRLKQVRSVPTIYKTVSRAHTTVNTLEVQKFSQLAADWWNPNGPMWTLHKINPVRVKYIRNMLCSHFSLNPISPTPLQDLSILDVGCGAGLLSEGLSRLGATVTGIDASEAATTVATQHAQKKTYLKNPPSYINTTAEDLQAQGKQFDVVCSLEVIEHVDNVPFFLNSLASLTKPGGALILSTINKTTKSKIFAITIAENVLGWVEKGTHDWNKFVKPEDLCNMLANNKITCRDITGMVYNPLGYFSKESPWQLDSSDIGVNYFLFSTKDE